VSGALGEENTADEGNMVAQCAYRPWGESGVGMFIHVRVGTS